MVTPLNCRVGDSASTSFSMIGQRLLTGLGAGCAGADAAGCVVAAAGGSRCAAMAAALMIPALSTSAASGRLNTLGAFFMGLTLRNMDWEY